MEKGLEHHLGLTCDPVKSLAQIPCIKRNVFAASRAINYVRYANCTDGDRISFDQVVQVMKETGVVFQACIVKLQPAGWQLFTIIPFCKEPETDIFMLIR